MAPAIRATKERGVKRVDCAITELMMPLMRSDLPRFADASACATTGLASMYANDGTPASLTPATSWNPVRVGPGHSAITVTPDDFTAYATASEKSSTNDLVAA